ncbi:MAG: VacB/RNase II family 3'-5' exoribonuclease [Acidobacteriaceae bacterium]|nr:VacB/RNase II family 3'-5' exoribonuclease [Acidobacteriaceae bacterium]
MPKHARRAPKEFLQGAKQFNDRTLLEHIRALPHSRATYKQLVRELRLVGENRDTLEEALDRLTEKGLLVELRSGHFIATGPESDYLTGRLSIHRDGFGFLIPDHSTGQQAGGDVFLPPNEAEKGMHGDRALVHVVRRSSEGRAEGEIIRILRRAHVTVVGEFRIRKRGNFVVPADDRIQQWIEIPEGMEIPPEQHALNRVGASVHQINTVEDLDRMIVNVEILEFPEGSEGAIGRVIEVLGYPDDFGVDVEIIIRKHHLPHQFPSEVIDQARRISSEIPPDELERRRDFRHLDIVTIDGETARDFDDAIWVEKLPNGNFALQVHIADVSHYVQPGTPIDEEALLRGTSVYFPDRAVPMLPVELSTDVCSLRPQEDRLVLSALLELDRQGDVISQEFTRGIIRSAERMTYTNVFRLLEGDPALRERYAKLIDRFELMRELALILNRKRTKRGSIDFDMPESNILLDMSGQMVGVTRAERNIAHRIIEEFMLAANEAVASHLETAGLPSIYRIHEQPDAKRVLDFEEVAAHFGYSLGVGAIPVKRFSSVQRGRDGRKTRKDITLPREDFDISSRNYQRLIAKIAGKPEERILSYLMLRSLKQARYSNINEGHFALAAPSYTHFTSPIRRYPDLIVHRILSHYLHTKSPLFDEGQLHELGNDTSFTERRAAEAERELIEWKKVKFMQDRVGDEFDALIISTTKFGFFVELSEFFVEGLVPIETLSGDRFTYHENGRKIMGERSRKAYSIGDAVRVRLDRADPVERKLQFALAGDTGRRGGKRK